jgi:hypothetical protein
VTLSYVFITTAINMLSMRNMTVGVQGLGCKHVEHEEHDCWGSGSRV